MVKVKIPEKFCRFTFCPLCPLLRSPSLFFTSFVSLPFSLSLLLAVLFVAYRQSLFHSLRVFEKHPLVMIFENVAQKRRSCHTDVVLPDRTFFFFSFLLLSFLPVASSLSSSITRAKRLDVLSVLSSTSWWLLVDFPFHIHVWSFSFSLSFTFVALGEELEANRAYTTHFTSLIRNNS